MNNKYKKLISSLLRIASERFARNACNDLDKWLFCDWTDEEKHQLGKDYHDWNWDPQETESWEYLPDFGLMHFLADKIDNEQQTTTTRRDT